jgi:hypothetical protein
MNLKLNELKAKYELTAPSCMNVDFLINIGIMAVSLFMAECRLSLQYWNNGCFVVDGKSP